MGDEIDEEEDDEVDKGTSVDVVEAVGGAFKDSCEVHYPIVCGAEGKGVDKIIAFHWVYVGA